MKARTLMQSLLISLLCAHPVLAHEGKTHVMGTVAAVDAQHVVVTDRDGKEVSINLTKGTKYEKGDAPAQASALKVGARVVIDVAGTPPNLTATEIRLGPAAPMSGHQHAAPHEGEHDHY